MDNPPVLRPGIVENNEDPATSNLVLYEEMQEPTLVLASSTVVVIEEVNRPDSRKHGPSPITVIVLDRARALLALLVASLFILTFILQPFRISSESMERTLLVGDFVLVNKVVFAPAGVWRWLLPYRSPRHGDILVFRFPLDGDDHVVKRIIGAGGDAIHLKNGVVYRNGQTLSERYTRQLVTWSPGRIDSYRDNFPNAIYLDPGVDARWWAELQHDRVSEDVIVPTGEYFVLGDNRNYSRDSRYWGFVPKQNIVGTPLLIYFSLREPSRTDTYLPPTAQDDRLGDSATGAILRFARWGRILRVVY